MKKKKISKEKVYKILKYKVSQREKMSAILGAIAAVLLSVISLSRSFSLLELNVFSICIIVCAFGVSLFSITLQIINAVNAHKFERDYQYYTMSKKITTALIVALKRSNYEKTCSILQSTYGNVPDWRPIDYTSNIIIYDVHQHLRCCCIRLKEMITNLYPLSFNDDMITVDIAFQYPIDNYLSKKESDWKIITSGDHTSSSVRLHDYLENKCSFYSYLDNQGYVFCNDKKEIERKRHYIWSSKDYEYKRIGSVIGTVIELKNDNPEAVFVKAYLTITTYGRKLVEDDDSLCLEDFERLFRETVINSYKTLIEAELAHMFIRHGIQGGYIDKKTGHLKSMNKNQNKCRFLH